MAVAFETILPPPDQEGQWKPSVINNKQFILRRLGVTLIFTHQGGRTRWNIQKIHGGRIVADVDRKLPESYIDRIRRAFYEGD